MRTKLNIVVVESSTLVYEGLVVVLRKAGIDAVVTRLDLPEELHLYSLKQKCDMVIINPGFVQNNQKQITAIKNQYEGVCWVALIYAFFEAPLLNFFDGSITISDSPEAIAATIGRLLADNQENEPGQLQDVISEREIDVLKLLASGMANKEIADKLNISINTVITHRKNITQKTGIKTVSGLTIYAVLKKLITLDNFTE